MTTMLNEVFRKHSLSLEEDSNDDKAYADRDIDDSLPILKDNLQTLFGDEAKFNDPAEAQAVEDLEKAIKVDLPADLKKSLRAANGAENEAMILGDPYQYAKLATTSKVKDGLIEEVGEKLGDDETYMEAKKAIMEDIKQDGTPPGLIQAVHLLGVKEIQERYEKMRKIDEKGDFVWKKGWIPFATRGNDKIIFIDTEEGGVYGLNTDDDETDRNWMIHTYQQWLSWCARATEIAVEVLTKYKKDEEEDGEGDE